MSTISFCVFFGYTSIWNGGTVGRSVKMMFSSKAEERVDTKDMVSNVFMCRKPIFCVGFYSVQFLLLVIVLFIFLLPIGPVCNI